MLCEAAEAHGYRRCSTRERGLASPKRGIPRRSSPVSLYCIVIKGFVDTSKGKIHLDCQRNTKYMCFLLLLQQVVSRISSITSNSNFLMTLLPSQ